MVKADPITIPDEERKNVKEQILSGLRGKYLRFKAEMLACDANAKTAETEHWQKQMDETVKAHDRVEADL